MYLIKLIKKNNQFSLVENRHQSKRRIKIIIILAVLKKKEKEKSAAEVEDGLQTAVGRVRLLKRP